VIVDVVVPFYANAESIRATLDAILGQHLPDGLRSNLIVVDDGTPDNGESAARLRVAHPQAHVLRLEQNVGRSMARNHGVGAGAGQYVMLLDSDCVLQQKEALASHVARLEQCDVSIGTVTSRAPGVWSELGNRAAAKRTADAESGILTLLTTAHVVMKRATFEAVGGFAAAYRYYGFEDRDLLGRLAAAGFRLAHSADLVAIEHDQPNLPGYVHKARMAGKHTAGLFRRDHPDLYAMTPYYRLDVGVHGWLRPFAALVKVVLPAAIRVGDRAIYWAQLPMGLRVLIVRSLFAGSFMVGSAERTRER
jgi:glycosyltransferase involved in cell wall biosynthesis